MHSPLQRLRAAQPKGNWTRFTRMPAIEGNVHLERIQEHFGAIMREPADIPDNLSFVFLCFTNRTGSNYLAELLASGGQYNRASEILNYPGVLEVARRAKLGRFQDAFAHIVRHQQRSGRYFVKTALLHLEVLVKSGVIDQVADRSQFILLERNDSLAQAISYAIAFATGAFTSDMASAEEAHEIAYSRAAIDRYLNVLGSARRHFALFFGRNGFVPVRVSYERLIADPEGEASWLASELGLADFSVDLSNVRLERQHSPVNDEWRRRYLAERQ